jgi:hypothetical protein
MVPLALSGRGRLEHTRQGLRPELSPRRVRDVVVIEWVPPLLLLLGFLIVVVPVGLYFGAVALLWASSLISEGSARYGHASSARSRNGRSRRTS